MRIFTTGSCLASVVSCSNEYLIGLLPAFVGPKRVAAKVLMATAAAPPPSIRKEMRNGISASTRRFRRIGNGIESIGPTVMSAPAHNKFPIRTTDLPKMLASAAVIWFGRVGHNISDISTALCGARGGIGSPGRQARHLSFARSGNRLLRMALSASCTSITLHSIPNSSNAVDIADIKLLCRVLSGSIMPKGYCALGATTQFFPSSLASSPALFDSFLVKQDGRVHRTKYCSS